MFYKLVTGTDGFSGSKVFKFLSKKNLKLLGVSRNKKSKNVIEWNLLNKNIIIKKKIDWIIHSAAIHKINDFKKKPVKKKNQNIQMMKNLIIFAKKNNIKNFIFFSTIDISLQNVFNKKKYYNLSKLQSEKLLLKAYKDKSLKKVIILRIPAILGKNANQNFIINTIEKLKKNLEISIDDKIKYNNFFHIDDICNLIFKIIKVSRNNKILDLSFFDTINCLSSNFIHISKKIISIKKKLKSKSNIIVTRSNKNYKVLEINNNRFNFKPMSCSNAIKLLL